MWLFWVFLFVALIVLLAESAEKAREERIRDAYTFNPYAAHGSARYSNRDDLKRGRFFKSGGIHIGFFEGRKLFVNATSHLLLVAGARAGKLVTILCAAILSLPKKYSLALFDPKAEITCICAHYLQASGRDVYVLNPFGILLDRMKGLKQATFNPASSLRPQEPSFHSDCAKLSEAVCYQEGHVADTHWIDSARQLLSGIIAALVKYGALEDKNLLAVRNVLTGANGKSVYDFCRECMTLPDPFIRANVARFAVTADPSRGIPAAEDSRELNSIISTAITQTAWIGNEAIAASLKGGVNEIDPRDLKRKAGTVFCTCLPLTEFSVADKWFRVLASTMVTVTLKESVQGYDTRVLGVFDEAYQIGYLRVLSDAWGMAAGAAQLQLWAIYQDVSQITSQFKTVWQTIVQNSGGAAIYFGIRDYQTAEFVSKQCGITEVISRSHNVSIDQRSGEPVVNDSATQAPRPLLHPDEVRFGLGPDEMLLFADGLPGVCRANRKKYTDIPELKGKFRDNPYFQKDSTVPRLLRWLFR